MSTNMSLGADVIIESPTAITKWQRICANQVIKKLLLLKSCYLIIRSPLGETIIGSPTEGLHAEIYIKDMNFFTSVVERGSIGAAESYMSGEWQANDLTYAIRILVRNRDLLDQMEGGVAAIAGNLMKLWHLMNRNTHSGSRKNIAAHYDLGNDLFQLFLDKEHMMYSAALYKTSSESLEQAQTNKLFRLCEQLQLTEQDHLVEIGTGWGGMAIFAAKHYNCCVTTTTISEEQFQLAQQRAKEAGVDDKITFLKQDYRDLAEENAGKFDKLISIEMVEAVGDEFLDGYFQACANLLKPGGRAAIQAITIEDHRYEQSLKEVDFIKRYIFPGSFIPCNKVLIDSATKSHFILEDLFDIGESYAITLKVWRERFFEQLKQVRDQGYSEEFIRMWEFYLCYCEGGFIEKSISDVHLTFRKSDLVN